ncbi:MAG: hypothetical protein NT154_28250, partial [Verrucomicrobia bacterium]|nr:hypothetical protein [Verrucomicrobiota bacterium]
AGSVDEPYLAGTPNVTVLFGRLLMGFTWAEAACAASSTLSWQTTVVGDPLYRPFGNDPDQLHKALVSRGSKLADWSWLRSADLSLVLGRPMAEVVTLLEELDATRHSAVLTEKLADLYAAQGKPSSAVQTYAHALTLEPSPQQRLRLLLTLGEKLMALDRHEAAYADYQRLLLDFPDYPDKVSIYRKLQPLALKLDKKSDAEKYEAEITRLSPPPPNPPKKP